MSATMGLSPSQDRLLRFIEARLSESRVSPSFEEMAAHMGSRSKSNVHRLIGELEDRGYVTRRPGRVRSIALASPLAKFKVYELMAELRNRGVPVMVETL